MGVVSGSRSAGWNPRAIQRAPVPPLHAGPSETGADGAPLGTVPVDVALEGGHPIERNRLEPHFPQTMERWFLDRPACGRIPAIGMLMGTWMDQPGEGGSHANHPWAGDMAATGWRVKGRMCRSSC